MFRCSAAFHRLFLSRGSIYVYPHCIVPMEPLYPVAYSNVMATEHEWGPINRYYSIFLSRL